MCHCPRGASPARLGEVEAKGEAWIDVKNRKDRLLGQVSMRVEWNAPAPAVSRRSGTGLDWTSFGSESGVMA